MNAKNIQLIDIYEVWYQPWWHAAWFSIILYLIACAVLFFMLYYMYRVGLFKKKLSYEQQILQDLNLLAAQSYSSQEQIRAAYFQITKLLKSYLAHVYGLALHDKTDLEIVPLLSEQLVQPLQSLLQEFFQRSFSIKFAHDAVVEQMLQDDIEFVKNVIDQIHKNMAKVGNS